MGEDASGKMPRDVIEWQRCCEVRGARVMQSVLQDRVERTTLSGCVKTSRNPNRRVAVAHVVARTICVVPLIVLDETKLRPEPRCRPIERAPTVRRPTARRETEAPRRAQGRYVDAGLSARNKRDKRLKLRTNGA